MYLVFLKFSDNKSLAPKYMQMHNDWINEHTHSGKFLMVGTLEPKQGGCIFAECKSMDEIKQLIANDPFVANDVVKPEILQVSPSKVSNHLAASLQKYQ